jgi:hypothetical protein
MQEAAASPAPTNGQPAVTAPLAAETTAPAAPNKTPLKDTVRGKKKPFSSSTQRFLPIAEVREDTVVLKNGGLRAILKVNALNFNLKSEIEQQGIISGYQGFLNTLIFPVQILIRSTRLNIDPYIKGLQARGEQQTSPLLREQTYDYASFMEKLVEIADIMQKSFYVIVPVDAPTKAKRGLIARFMDWLTVDDTRAKALQRSREFRAYNKILRDRITLIQSGLENVGITMRRLKTEEIIQLYYTIYNPMTSQKQKFSNLEDVNPNKAALF